MAKNKGIFLLTGGIATLVFFVTALFFFGVFQYASITPYTDTGNLGDVENPFVSGQIVCEQKLVEDLPAIQGQYQLAVCRRCEKADAIVQGVCHLGCGEVCPTNSQCYYPSSCGCPNGCCPDNSGSYCNGAPCCIRSPTDRSAWEAWAQGCTVAYKRGASATFIVWNTETVDSAQIQFSKVCDPNYVEAGTPTGDVIVTPQTELPSASENISCTKTCSGDTPILNLDDCSCVAKIAPVICQLDCGNNYVPDYEKCICVRASSDTTLPATETYTTETPSIPRPYKDPNAKIYGAIFLLLAIVSLVFTIWQATKRK